MNLSVEVIIVCVMSRLGRSIVEQKEDETDCVGRFWQEMRESIGCWFVVVVGVIFS